MAKNPITRRDVLKTLAIGVAGGSVFQSVPLQAAQHVHRMIAQEKSNAPAGRYRPKFFSARQYQRFPRFVMPSSRRMSIPRVPSRQVRRNSSISLRAKTRTINWRSVAE